MSENLGIKKYANKATEFASFGFDQKQIEELLKIEGCSVDFAEKISISSIDNMPVKYDLGHIPQSYADVKKTVEVLILYGDIDKIKYYFNKYALKYSEIVSMIIAIRESQSHLCMNEIHGKLRPLIEGIILKNTVEAKNTKEVSLDISEKDNLEMVLFGIWSIVHIEKLTERLKGEDLLIEKSKEENHKISYISKYRDRSSLIKNYFKKE